MTQSHRLLQILQLLSGGALTTAQELAEATGVSLRTIYRDMDKLVVSGLSVEGTRGHGYRLADVTTLPSLVLTDDELEALNLALAIAAEVADPTLKSAALTLSDKVDEALALSAAGKGEAWKFANTSFADTARGLAQMPTLRAAIKARQKLRITYTDTDGTVTSRVIRPLKLEYWHRIWTLTTWCESTDAHAMFRLDLINTSEALPELFTDEAGKTLADFRA